MSKLILEMSKMDLKKEKKNRTGALEVVHACRLIHIYVTFRNQLKSCKCMDGCTAPLLIRAAIEYPELVFVESCYRENEPLF